MLTRRSGIAVAVLAAMLGITATSVAQAIRYQGGLDGVDEPTWRVFVFAPEDGAQLLGIFGTEAVPLFFETYDGSALRNTGGPFAGTNFEDIPFPATAEWDSWVTIGLDTPPVDVAFTPGAFGGNGSQSVIRGSSFAEEAGGGWFDTSPDASPIVGDTVLIAQFTSGLFVLQANARWRLADGREVDVPFVAQSGGPWEWDGACCIPGQAGCSELVIWECLAAHPEACFHGYGSECIDVDDCAPDRPCCPEDLDHDLEVSMSDLRFILFNWNHQCDFGCNADLNNDAIIDFTDLLTMLSAWGPCE